MPISKQTWLSPDDDVLWRAGTAPIIFVWSSPVQEPLVLPTAGPFLLELGAVDASMKAFLEPHGLRVSTEPAPAKSLPPVPETERYLTVESDPSQEALLAFD